jgi:hypothetical protein
MAASSTVRAVDLILYINGKVFGVATSMNWEISTGSKAIRGIDQDFPFELAPGSSMVRGSVECMRQHDDAGVEGFGIVAIQDKLSNGRYFSLQLIDRETDSVVLQVLKASLTSQQWRVQAKGVLTGSFSWEALQYSNEF